MTRRAHIAAGSAAVMAEARPRGPNVLLFLTDQETQRVRRDLLKLPNRERLERQGARFERNWCATPQCSPARAALLTGRYPHRTGVLGNVGAAGGAPLRAADASLGNVFKKAGYRAGYFGKWHLSQGSRAGWEDHGFEAAPSAGGGDAAVAAAAVRWLAGAAGQPWLCVVSLIQPHDIYEYPLRAAAAAAGRKMPIRDGIPAPAATAADLNDRPRPPTPLQRRRPGAGHRRLHRRRLAALPQFLLRPHRRRRPQSRQAPRRRRRHGHHRRLHFRPRRRDRRARAGLQRAVSLRRTAQRSAGGLVARAIAAGRRRPRADHACRRAADALRPGRHPRPARPRRPLAAAAARRRRLGARCRFRRISLQATLGQPCAGRPDRPLEARRIPARRTRALRPGPRPRRNRKSGGRSGAQRDRARASRPSRRMGRPDHDSLWFRYRPRELR